MVARLTILSLFACSFTASRAQNPKIAYEFRMTPALDGALVTGHVDIASSSDSVSFRLERCIGGRKLNIVSDVRFTDAAGFPILATVDSTDSADRWTARTDADEIRFSYTLSVNESELLALQSSAWQGMVPRADERMLYLSRYAILIPEQAEDWPVHVKFDVPDEWQVIGPWPAAENSLVAPGLHALTHNYFGAFEAPSVIESWIEDVQFQIVWTGDGSFETIPSAIDQLTHLLTSVVRLAGNAAMDDKMTIIMHDSAPDGAMMSGTAGTSTVQLQFPTDLPLSEFWPSINRRTLHTVAHELFHTTSYVKEGDASQQSDVGGYSSEMCWIKEGFTDYFANVALLDAGLMNLQEFANEIERTAKLANGYNPDGSLSLLAACDNFYSDRSAFLYTYYEGALLAFVLDAELRRLSDGAKKLPEFMREFLASFESREKSMSDFLGVWYRYAPAQMADMSSLLERVDSIDPTPHLKRLGGIRRVSGHRDADWFIPGQSLLAQYFAEAL